MTVYDRDLLEAIRTAGRELHNIGKELHEIRKQLEAAPRPITAIIERDLPDLETYFERLEDVSK